MRGARRLASLRWGSDAMNARRAQPLLAPGGSDFGVVARDAASVSLLARLKT